ncbi:nucleoid occlusion protein [Natronospora cellulosivora (SeqCode)]
MKIPFIQDKKNQEVIKVNIESISTNPYQPRLIFNQDEIDELAQSIKNYGIIQPLLVRSKGEKYELVAGERRLRACKSLGMDKVSVVVKELNDIEMAEIALVENLQRKDLNFLEEAQAYQQLIEKFSLTQQELAEKLGKGQSTIANKLRLLTLASDVRKHIDVSIVSERHARALLKMEDKNKQIEVLNKIKEKKLTVKESEQLINNIINKPLKSKPQIIYKDLRLFTNTLKKTINEMKEAGLNIKVERKEEEDYFEFKIHLPKETK